MKKVTKRQAEVALSQITHQLWNVMSGDYGPFLVQDFDGADWAIVWEDGAPYEWVHLAFNGGYDAETGLVFGPTACPKGVFAEPLNNCVLGLYPE